MIYYNEKLDYVLLDKKRLFEAVEDVRYKRRWTQAEMAQVLGIKPPAYSQLKRGRNYTPDIILRMMVVTAKSPIDFIRMDPAKATTMQDLIDAAVAQSANHG
jgi:transcriptional regulator with XRE-family HTH domain